MKTHDIIVLILASTVAAILIIVIVGSLTTGKPMSEKGAEIISDMNMAIIAIISMYIGSKIKS